MKIRDLICFGGVILTGMVLIVLNLWDKCPRFIPLIPLCIMVVCFIIDSFVFNDGEDNWFDKKINHF